MKRITWCGIAAAVLIGHSCTVPVYAGSWQQESGFWYYLNEEGNRQTGWLELDDQWYYLGTDGRMVTGTQKIRGITYQFHEDGSLIEGPGNQVQYGTALAPNVTSEMCTAQYWINRSRGSETVLMKPEEIQSLNRSILNTPETNTSDLSALPERFNGIELAEKQASFPSPKGLYLDSQPVPERYYESIRQNIKNAAVTADMQLRFGFAVNRTEMKAYPYDDFLSDSQSDIEWDNLVSTAVRVNEPLAIYYHTADGKYAFVKSKICSGWVPSQDIAVCRDKAEWESAREMKHVLVVTGEKIYLESGMVYPEASEKCLTMGTTLELVLASDEQIMNRLPWNSYVVKLPYRNADGSFTQKEALIPANRDVNVGYLPFSSAQILRQAFKCLGNRYGWGGMLNAQDCSGMVVDIYKCFGLEIPRNTTWQAAMPVAKQDLAGMTDEEKDAALSALTPGTIVQFPGHEMIYLGKVNGRHYTINDVSSLVSPPEDDTGDRVLRVRSVIVNDLSTKRRSGHTWFEDVTRSIAVWQ